MAAGEWPLTAADAMLLAAAKGTATCLLQLMTRRALAMNEAMLRADG